MAYEIIPPEGRYEIIPAEQSMADSVKQGAGNLLAGAVRGAGSIGATILAPYDVVKDAIAGKGLSLDANRQRRSDMDAALQSLGAEPDSLMYKGGKLAGEVAGTAGVGGVLAKPVQALSNLSVRAGAGAIPGLDSLAMALQTGGFRTGNVLPAAQNLATRIGAGAAVGGASAGLVSPEDAGFGAIVGGAMPAGAQILGKVGDAAGKLFSGGVAPSSQKLATARDAINAGYVIPPNMVNPGFKNQVIESFAGKQATQQIASTRNNKVTEGLVRDALGIADDVPLSQGTLENLRETAGRAYAEVSDLSPQAAADLEALKTARNESQGWFKAYNRSARPDDLLKAKEARTLATQLETALESHAQATGRPELIPALRDARREIAKTYTVGRALNDASGNVNANVFARMHEKGLPLSDGLDVVGRFASAFPTVAKTPEQIGSPAAHNLKAFMSMGFGGIGGATAGPLGVAAGLLPFVTPPIARSMMFSRAAQQGLLNPQMAGELPLGLLTQGAYRAAPLLSAQ